MRIEIKPNQLKAVRPSNSNENIQREKELLKKNGGPEKLVARVHSELQIIIGLAVEACLNYPEIPLSGVEVVFPQLLPKHYWALYSGPHFWSKHHNLNCLNKFLQNSYKMFWEFSVHIEADYNDGRNVLIKFCRNQEAVHAPPPATASQQVSVSVS